MASDGTGDRSPQVLGPGDWREWTAPRPLTDGIDALAALVALHADRHRTHALAEAERFDRPRVEPVLIVGLAGPVASGKSTIAAALADRLGRPPAPVVTEVLSTDAYLRPNAELEARGLSLRKGFPESYDHGALRSLHRKLRRGDRRIRTPVYSHQDYDIAQAVRWIDRPSVLVLEGVNALQTSPDGGAGPGDLVDLGLYIDVAEDQAIEWFTERFVELTVAARADPSSFYGLWASLPEDGIRRAAREVWDAVNGVNLREHIEPSRHRADIEIVKATDHEVIALRLYP